MLGINKQTWSPAPREPLTDWGRGLTTANSHSKGIGAMGHSSHKQHILEGEAISELSHSVL